MRKIIGLIIFSMAIPGFGVELYIQDFSTGSWPAGYTFEGNWQIGTNWDGNDTPPAAIYNWTPRQTNFEHNMTTDYIDVGENDGVLIKFDFALDFYYEDELNGLRISYHGGTDWVTVLDYAIGPDAGDVDVSRRTESFTADIESGADLQIRWTAYGDDSWAINGWIVDNIQVLTLPKLTSVTIESANEDPATATAGTNIWLNFMVDSELSIDPYVQINGTACNIDNLGSTNWVAYYTVTELDPDGPLQFTIDFTDINGIDGKTVKETTNGSKVIVDNSDPPGFTVGTVTVSGGTVAENIWNSTNTEVQMDVGVPQDSAVIDFDYTVGNSLLFDGMNDQLTIPGIAEYQATDALTVEVWVKPNSYSDNEGFLNYAMDNGASEAGFGFVYFATGWRFYLKTNSNTIEYSNMAEASTPVGQWTHLAATFDGNQVVIFRNGAAIDSADALGNIDWTNAPDNLTLGNFSKDGSVGYFDGMIDEVRIWSVVRSAFQIKASKESSLNGDETGLIGYWPIDIGSGNEIADSSSNGNNGTVNGASWITEDSPIYFQDPVYDTGVIVGSSFQLRGRIGLNAFEGFGEKDTISIDDFNAGTMTLTASDADFEAIANFEHESTVQLSAYLFDVAGNYSEGDTSTTELVIDLIANSPDPVSISSNNNFSHLAKTGDIVTITVAYDEDVETPSVAVGGNDADEVTDLGSEQFSSTYTLTGSETDGSLSFTLTTMDYLGNPGSHSGSTDGSTVVFDGTEPTVNPMTIVSSNPDPQWAKVGDTVRLDIGANEILFETVVTMAEATMALYDSTDAVYNGSSECSGGEIVTDNLRLWLDANDVDGDGLSEGMNEDNLIGSEVVIWADKSGNGADVSEVANLGLPDLVENQFNGNNSLMFNRGQEDVLVHDLGVDKWTATEYSLFIVFQMIGTPQNYDSFFSNGDINNGDYFQITQLNGVFRFLSNGQIDFEPWDNELKLYGVLGSTTSTTTIVDGNEVNSSEMTNGRNFDKYKINWNRLNYQHSDSYIAEVLLYDRELDEDELTKTYKYLGNKYGKDFSNDTTVVYTKREMTAMDPEGMIAINFTHNDCAGNDGTPVSETTDGSYVIFDMTAPTDFSVDTVISTGGNTIENAWNSTNTGLNVLVPVANDTTLKNGWVQIWVKIGANAYEMLGDSSVIIEAELNTNKTIPFTAAQIEAITGFAEENTMTFKAVMSDRPGNETTGGESSFRLVIDQTPPAILSSHIESNNADTTKAKVGDIITISLEVDEAVQPPTITIASGSGNVTDLGSFKWSATYTMLETDDEGIISFTVNEIMDASGNPVDGFTSTSDGSQVVLDRTKPVLNNVSANSWNTWNQSWAKLDDGGRIYSNTSEGLLTISGTINSQATTLYLYSDTEFDLNYTFTAVDPEGPFSMEIVYTDSVGNEGDTVITTTNGSLIIFDNTPPTDFTTGDVTSTGGNVVTNVWNSTNTGLDVIVPIESDATLDSGRVQIYAKVGSNPYEKIGDYEFIQSEEVGAIKTVSFPRDSIEALVGYAENDTLYFKSHLFDIPGNETEGAESATKLLIDETHPVVVNSSIKSNNADTTRAKVGDIITISLEVDEAVQTPTMTIASGSGTVTDLGSFKWSGDYTMLESDEEGIVSFTVDELVDARGNPADGFSETLDETQVLFDRTKPALIPVIISSNNPYDTGWAKSGDMITLTFEASEDLLDTAATLLTNETPITDLGESQFQTEYTTIESDPEGEVPFQITYSDLAGNVGDTVTNSTNGNGVIYDRTVPSMFTVGALETTGGNSVENAWNSTNTGLKVTIPVENDTTLKNGWVQVWAKIGANDYEALGSTSIILEAELGTDKIISFIESEIESITSFGEEDTLTVKAVIFDIPGNNTEGSASLNRLVIDQTPPVVVNSHYESNYSDSTLATIGHIITVTFETDEVIAEPSISISGGTGDITGIGDFNWSGTYTMQESDEEGVIPFSVDSLLDARGNPEDGFDTPTDESEVVFDKTQPTLNPVTVISNNPDPEWAKVGDTITVSFTGEEELMTAAGTIVTQIAAVIDLGGENYTAKYEMTETDPEGEIAFEIIVTDLVGLNSDPVSETTDESSVIFDRTLPQLDYVHIESSNSNNTSIGISGDDVYLTFTPNEPLILDSMVVTISETPATVAESEGSYTSKITLTGAEADGILSYTIDFKDRAGNPGNQVTSTTDDSYVNHDILPPEILSVSIASNNPDTSWAKVGDSIFVTFTATEVLDNITVNITGVSTGYDNPSTAKYRGLYVMNEDDEEGTISFYITYTDLGGAPGPDADTTTNGTEVLFDRTNPNFSLTKIFSNNVYGDTLAGIGTTDTLRFQISEEYRDLNITLAGSEKIPSQDGLSITAAHTFIGNEDEGWVQFSISMTDSAGNESGELAETQDGSRVRFDGTLPELSWVTFYSNNVNDSTLCIPGDSLYLRYTASETLRTGVITIVGNSPDMADTSDGIFIVGYEMTGAEDEGFIPFTVGFEDWVGNSGDTVTASTNGSTVLFDMTPPDDFTLGDVSSNDGIEVSAYWNGSNQYLEAILSIPDDATLTNGGIQLQSSYGDIFSDLADTTLIDESDLGTEKRISVLRVDFEGSTGYSEGGNITFKAIMWDKAGNATTGTESESVIHIDETSPTMDSVSHKTNNAIADSLAKVGDTDTLIFRADEGLDSLKVQVLGQDAFSFGSNKDWQATYEFQDSDMDGSVTFNIIYGDTAGNLGVEIMASTDGSWVRFDGTLPTLTDVTFISTNDLDRDMAIMGDTLYLDFISGEDLLSREVFIAGSNADTTFENQFFRTPFRSWRIMDGTEDEGYIPFKIGFSDLVGNVGDTVEATTDESSVLFDMTPPADFELDTVFVSGGNIVLGYWNSTNDSVTLKVPVPADDETLIGGIFQPQVRFDDSSYINLGDEISITGVFNIGQMELSVPRSDFITMDGYEEGENAQFTAVARDKAGNETIGTSDNSILHIDETVPELTSVIFYSNNDLDTSLAKVSDNITLTYIGSEGLAAPTGIMIMDTLELTPVNAGTSWVGSRTMVNNDPEGFVPFYITYSDTAGNEGTLVSESTNGSSVILDKTNPIISNLLEGSEREDIAYYNISDSITLYWEQDDALSGNRDAFVALGTNSQNTDIVDWTLSGIDPFSGLGGLDLENDGIYFGGVFVRDSAGNHSDTIWGNSVYIDIEIPDTGSIVDGYWIMDLDYILDSTRLRYIWKDFSDNTEIDFFEIAIGTGSDTTNIMNWMQTDSTDSMTVTGLSLIRDTLYFTYIRAVDLATNISYTARTDGVYFDDIFPMVKKISPNFVADSAGFLSVLNNDTITIKFNRPIYLYELSVNSNVEADFISSHEYGDSVITVIWTDTLSSYDTLTVIVDSAVAYNTLWVTDTLHFYSKLWGDLNNDYDITLEDILAFNQNWPETDLGPFNDFPPHVRPAPDGEADLKDLSAFAKMWNWKYFNLEFDKTLFAARSMDGLNIFAQGSKAKITIPKETAMAEILIGETNLDIEKMSLINPSGSAFMFTVLDTAHGLKQFSLADYRGFDTLFVLNLPETDQEYFQAQIQYKFMNREGIVLSAGVSSIDIDILPDKFTVYNNYPNPFNPVTTIRYDLPEVRNVDIIIYDLLGRTVRHMDLKKVQAGRHKFAWHGTNDNGKRVSTGIYFLQITAGQDTRIQKMLLLK